MIATQRLFRTITLHIGMDGNKYTHAYIVTGATIYKCCSRHYTFRFNECETGYIGFTLAVRRPIVRQSVDGDVTALYLPQHLPDPFYINTSYQLTAEGVWRVEMFI